MTNPMPKWLTKRYAILWGTIKEKEFHFEDALKFLNEADKKQLSVILSEIKKHGWIIVILDPKDSRKRIYKLKEPKQIMYEISQRS